MKIIEAFKYQIENTRLLTEEDLGDDDEIMPAVWNGVIFRPNGNYYSSGKEMKVGDKLLVCYILESNKTPTAFLMEESELSKYEQKFTVVRVASNVPVLEWKENLT